MTAAAVSVLRADRLRAVRRARLLNRFSITWNVLEAGIALTAGLVAGSISLIGFGLDSVVEVSASVILAWRLSREGDDCTQADDRRATRAVAISFFALGAYVGIEALRGLAAGDHPDASTVGVVLAAVSLMVMPFLARAKRQVAPILGSQAQAAEANQTQLCAVLSGVLLVGLLANGVLGWWWADGLAAVGIAVLATREGLQTWRAESLADTCCH
jgi:divalent metal cation (Fe/Co/Zn/Cd) transporter